MQNLIIILLFVPALSFGQEMSNSIGVVTLSEEYDNTDHRIEFLNEDGSTWDAFNCYGPWDELPDIRIIAFKPDYFVFKVKCQRETPNYYVVVVNEEAGLTKKIKKSNKVILINWEQYVTDVFSVDFDPNKVKIYDKINGTPVPETPVQETIIVPKEVKGEWMKVIWTSGEYNYPSDTSDIQTGWIRWRVNNKITVTVYHLS